MNLLLGKFSWCSLVGLEGLLQPCACFEKDSLSLCTKRMHNFNSDSKPFYYSERGKILCAIIGYVQNLEGIKSRYGIACENDVEVVTYLYLHKNLEMVSDLDGLFTVFICDWNIRRAYIFQDDYASNLPLYYACNEDEFVFSTSLRYILRCANISRKLDIKGVYDFLYSQWAIPNRSTLIEGVFKLVPGEYILVDDRDRCVKVKRLRRKEPRVSLKVAKSMLLGTISDNTRQIFGQLRQKEPALTLSSGYDSNFVLHNLREVAPATIKPVTVGGKNKNEIPVARLIVRSYGDIEHITSQVEQDALDSFPDIVWRYEGYINEVGVFLTYQLARILTDERCTCVFLGDCADQRLGWYRRTRLRWLFFKALGIAGAMWGGILKCVSYATEGKLPELSGRNENACYMSRRELYKFLHRDELAKRLYRMFDKDFGGKQLERTPYDQALDYILKKSGILLNSFSIQGIYPFLNCRTKVAAKALRRLGLNKAFYKEQVRRVINPDVARYLVKIPGSTDIEYLFTGGRKELMQKVLNSKFIASILNRSKIDDIIKKARFNSDDFSVDDSLLQLLNLYLFNELFISGKYDSKFDQSGIGISLGEFFDGPI